MITKNIREAINEYRRAGEVVQNLFDVAFIEGKMFLTAEESISLREELYEGEMNGARAEGRITEIRQLSILRARAMQEIKK